MRATAALLLSLTAWSGCTALTNFNTSKLHEDSDALCSDGIDDDGNGLTDCDDFGCLEQPVCCTVPRIAIEDDFSPPCSTAACSAPDTSCRPDSDVWQSWGSPAPLLCQGGLSPAKIEQCYDVGVLSTAELPLAPGLVARATVVGVPEPRARLTMGVTLQQEITGNADPCADIITDTPVISLREIDASDGGVRFVATFDGADLVASASVAADVPHALVMSIEDDRRVHYQVDGTEMAVSPAEHPLPGQEMIGHLVLGGRGTTARFDDVSVTVGTDCEEPGAWQQSDPFQVLGVVSGEWDGHGVFAPALAPRADGGMDMYYSGCSENAGACDPLLAGLGMAVGPSPSAAAGTDLSFTRSQDCPLVGPASAICTGGIANPFVDSFNNLIDAAPFEIGERHLALISQLMAGSEIATVDLDQNKVLGGATDRIRVGASGAWDAGEVCCASALVANDRVYAWYAGRVGSDGPWQIGLATSDDGVTFTKDSHNPVLRLGAPGTFDESGASAPSVLFERGLYRMWYEATGFFGATGIGYAVSTDGVTWHKFPGNPVVSAAGLGLDAVRGPSVARLAGRLIMLLGQDQRLPGSAIYGLINQPTSTSQTP